MQVSLSEYDYLLKGLIFSEDHQLGKRLVENLTGQSCGGYEYAIHTGNYNKVVKYQFFCPNKEAIFRDPSTYYANPTSNFYKRPHFVFFIYDAEAPNLDAVQLYMDIINSWYEENDPRPFVYFVGSTEGVVKEDREVERFILQKDKPNFYWLNNVDMNSKASLSELLYTATKKYLKQKGVDLEPPRVSSNPHRMLNSSRETPVNSTPRAENTSGCCCPLI